MALHSGIDTVAYISNGIYSKTYGSGNSGNIANLFASLGLLEDAPAASQAARSYLYRLYFYLKNKWRSR